MDKVQACGDSHSSQATAIIQINGTMMVYKYHQLDVDVVWYDFSHWLMRSGFWCKMISPQVLIDDEQKSYCEYIAHEPLTGRKAAARYYERCGGLLCITYLLGSRDLHCENLIAHGEYPVLVDLETLLAGEVRSFMEPLDAPAPGGPMEYIRDSVLYTSLLPHHVRMGEDSADTSGFAGQLEGGIAPCRNLPYLKSGERIGPQDYVDEIVEGFKKAYKWICTHKREILEESPYRKFAKCPVRYLIRNTQVYANLINRLAQPDMQADAEKYECQLAKLSLAYTKYAHPTVLEQVLKLYEAEAAAVRRGDIPYFSAVADETALRDENGEVLYAHYFRTSAFDRSLAVLEKMCPDDCELQVDLIRASFHAAYPQKAEQYPRKQRISLSDAALDIKRRLMEMSYTASDGASAWLTPCGPTEGACGIRATESALYGGRTGVALFMAALGASVGDKEACDTAVMLAEAVIRHTEARFVNHTYLRMPLGWASGLGGMLAALWDISRYLDRPELYPVHWIEYITPEWVEMDREYDVLGGAAGLLMALKRCGCCDTGKIGLLAEHILAGRTDWQGRKLIFHPQYESQPLNGFGHGACGLAAALKWAAAMTGNVDYESAADEMLDYVDSCYDEEEGNWPDYRINDAEHTVFMHGWCSGAPGIGVGCIDLQMNSERALRWTLDCGELSRDTLCCGNCTLVDYLVMEGYCEIARERAFQMTERRERYMLTGYQGTHVLDVGLFSGLAGVGYAYLRAEFPEKVRSILI